MALPEWALKYRKKGTQIVRIRESLYLYKVTSRWDREKKRAQKVTERYLGRITPDGLVKPRHERMLERLKNVSVREYGASFLMKEVSKDIIELLQENFDEWKEIFVFAAMRLLHTTPIKNLEFHYETSFLSELVPGAQLSDGVVGQMLREIGIDRSSMTEFMRNFVSGGEYAAIDITHVFSLSEGVISSVLGHNSKGEYLPQVNLFYIFSIDRHAPSYFRVLVGSVNSVSSLKLTLRESGAKNVVLVGDKGFYSSGNAAELESAGLHYILPLRRDSSLIDYERMKKEDMRLFRSFIFEGRPIWCYSHRTGKARIFVFLDNFLRAEEQKDFLARTAAEEEEEGSPEGKEKKEERMNEFYEHQHRFGTISVLTDLADGGGERVYQLLKRRVEVEQLFDTLKNALHADRTYMRDDYQLEGWMFVNFVAMMVYYRIYNMLMDRSLLKKYSPRDVLMHFSRIHMLKIEGKWTRSEIPKKTRSLIEKLEIPIT